MIRLALQLIMLLACLTGIMMRGSEVWRLAEGPISIEVSVPPPSTNVRVPAEPTLIQPAFASFEETMRRPIFFEKRQFPRPSTVMTPAAPPTPVAPPPAPSVSADQFRLIGIVFDANGKRALIEAPAMTLSWYDEGTKLRGWSLDRIENNSVFLSFGAKSVELRLFRGAEQN